MASWRRGYVRGRLPAQEEINFLPLKTGGVRIRRSFLFLIPRNRLQIFLNLFDLALITIFPIHHISYLKKLFGFGSPMSQSSRGARYAWKPQIVVLHLSGGDIANHSGAAACQHK
jgi:hypothetical protein